MVFSRKRFILPFLWSSIMDWRLLGGVFCTERETRPWRNFHKFSSFWRERGKKRIRSLQGFKLASCIQSFYGLKRHVFVSSTLLSTKRSLLGSLRASTGLEFHWKGRLVIVAHDSEMFSRWDYAIASNRTSSTTCVFLFAGLFPSARLEKFMGWTGLVVVSWRNDVAITYAV